MNFAHLVIFPETSDVWKQFSPLNVQGQSTERCWCKKVPVEHVVIDCQWHNMLFVCLFF